MFLEKRINKGIKKRGWLENYVEFWVISDFQGSLFFPTFFVFFFIIIDWWYELWSFRPKVDSPEGVRSLGIQSIRSMTYNTLQGETTSPRYYIVNLGFHMCSHCLSTLSSFFSGVLQERQIHPWRTAIRRIDLLAKWPATFIIIIYR